MKYNSIHNEIKSYIVQCGYTMTEVVNQLNLRRPNGEKTTVQNFSNKLSRGTIKYSEVLEIAEVIGLKVSWESATEEV